jgi:hypothetical protein
MTTSRRPTPAALAFAVAAATGVLLLYLIHPLLEGFRLPIGPDGPVYTWLARLAGDAGFVDTPGGGAGVPALTLLLGTLLRTEPVETVALLGPVLAAAAGLAAGALLEVTLGEDRIRTAAGIGMTGAFAAYLAGGWLANLALVGIFLLAVAALAGTSSRSMWAGVALLVAAGLTHRIFVVIGAAILLGAAAWHLLQSRRRGGEGRRAALRLGIAAIAGPAVALLVGAWVGRGPGIPGDTAQDGFLRRAGLRDLLLDRYRERFTDDAARAAVPGATGLMLSIPWARAGRDEEDRPRFLRGVLQSWVALSVVAIVVLATTGWGPPYRVIQFAFFLPLGAAAGLAVVARGPRPGAILGAAAFIAFVSFAMVGWFRQTPAFSADDAAAAARAGAVVSSLPSGTPLLFIVDTDERAAAYHVTRAANLIRMTAPAERIADVRVVVGRPRDLLEGEPTITGDQEHDHLSEVYLREASPLMDRAAILVVRRFNTAGFDEALADGVVVGEGVVALARGEEMNRGSAMPRDGPRGLGATAWPLLALAAIGTLGLLGFGWARWILPGPGMRAVALAAPSAGAAVTIVAVIAAERIGVLPGSAGSILAVLSAGVVGYVLARKA